MEQRPFPRRLAAILAADVVGYSRLMENDEAGTLGLLRERQRRIVNPALADHGGRLVKEMGDGFLVEFASAVDAVRCALTLQAASEEENGALPPERRMRLRIGVALGDVIVDSADIFGEGVNVAARLEQFARPGDICVSRTVYEQVRRRLDVVAEDLGPQVMKNLSEPVHTFRLGAAPARDASAEPLRPETPQTPSLVVLPFANPGGDPENGAFADGLTEDLITDLSRQPGLFVIARHSSFAYKDRATDIRGVARDLGVRYVLEGSARRAASRVRINVQLVDAGSGGLLWADRFDHSVEDIFAVQDQVTERIRESLVGRLAPPAPRNRPASLEAYDLCVRARALVGVSPEAAREGCVLLERAIRIDPNFAEAHRWLAFLLWSSWSHWFVAPEAASRRRSLELAQRAVDLDPADAGCRWVLGHVLAYERRFEEADDAFAQALRLDPNDADALILLAETASFRGEPEAAIDLIGRALRLNPHPPGWYYWELGIAQYLAHAYEDAVRTLRRETTYRTGSRRILAASLAKLGRLDEAREEAALFLAANPDFTTSGWMRSQPFRDPAVGRHLADGYRMAGLPD